MLHTEEPRVRKYALAIWHTFVENLQEQADIFGQMRRFPARWILLPGPIRSLYGAILRDAPVDINDIARDTLHGGMLTSDQSCDQVRFHHGTERNNKGSETRVPESSTATEKLRKSSNKQSQADGGIKTTRWLQRR